MLKDNRGVINHLRVCSLPGPRHVQNSYFPLLWRVLKDAGLDMIDPPNCPIL
jgi:hypothetical protein